MIYREQIDNVTCRGLNQGCSEVSISYRFCLADELLRHLDELWPESAVRPLDIRKLWGTANFSGVMGKID